VQGVKGEQVVLRQVVLAELLVELTEQPVGIYLALI